MLFDPHGRGPYTGVADDTILFWLLMTRYCSGMEILGLILLIQVRPVSLCDPKPSLSDYLKDEHICSRALGLQSDKKTGEFCIPDVYLGLMKVGPQGGVLTSLATEAEGVPLRFTDDLDIDEEGNIYFTDSSIHYQRRNFMQLVFSADDSGRVLNTTLIQNKPVLFFRISNFQMDCLEARMDHSLYSVKELLADYGSSGRKARKKELLKLLQSYQDFQTMLEQTKMATFG